MLHHNCVSSTTITDSYAIITQVILVFLSSILIFISWISIVTRPRMRHPFPLSLNQPWLRPTLLIRESHYSLLPSSRGNFCSIRSSRTPVPVFVTITKSNIAKYNNQLLEDRVTSCLHHSDSYESMQKNCERAYDIINGHIKHINRRNKVATPLCHNVIINHRGRKGRYKTHDWSRLYDGIHGKPDTIDAWAKSIRSAMDINSKPESDSDDSTKSPKRSWLVNKRQRTN